MASQPRASVRSPAAPRSRSVRRDLAAPSTEPKCRSSALMRASPRPGTSDEHATGCRAGGASALVGDGEAVRLVAEPLQQVERLAGARQDHRVVLPRQPDLLEPLRDAAQRDLLDARRRRARARRPRPAACRRRRRAAAAGRRIAGACAWSTTSASASVTESAAASGGLGRILRVAAIDVREPAREHLVDRVRVVRRLGNAERAVLVLARQPVLEHHHRRDDVRPAQVRDVVALDPQRRLGEAEGLLQVGERLGAGDVVARAARLVAGSAPAGRSATRSS